MKVARCNRFYRPSETFHASWRKFLEREVFKSDSHDWVALSDICGRCAVLPVKEYLRSRPAEGFDEGEEDMFACESRYSARSKSFK